MTTLLRLSPMGALCVVACAAAVKPAQRAERFSLDTEPSAAVRRVADRLDFDARVFGSQHELLSPPTADREASPGIAQDARWLERTRGATVRIGQICSGAIVSQAGLVLTTQSCVRECITATTQRATHPDSSGTVFARSTAEERTCPGLFVDVLRRVRDVTGDIDAAMAGAPPGQESANLAAARARLVQNCGAAPGRVCEAVPLYGGARWHLYEYDRSTTVKLVFATDARVANPGGAADQFAWPRHALDFAVLRLFERDGRRPLRTPSSLRLRAAPPAPDEPMLVAWSPGSTSRLATFSQLAYERDIRHPQNVQMLDSLRAILDGIAVDPALRRGVRDELFNARGSLALFRAQLDVLQDSLVPGARLKWERELRAAIDADPALRARYADVWDRLTALQHRKAALSPRLNASNIQIIGAPHLVYGSELVAWVRAMAIPADKRPREWTGERRARAASLLTDRYEVSPELATRFLTVHLALVERWIVEDDPIRAGVIEAGERPEDAARRLVAGSRLLDPDHRRSIMDGGEDALAAVDDPLLRYAAAMDSVYRDVLASMRALLAEEEQQRQRLGAAVLEVFGPRVAPDATFSPRIATGIVRGYGGLPAHTTFRGLYDHWDMREAGAPEPFRRSRADAELGVPLNFVLAADAFGSGGAVIDGEGRLAGIIVGTNREHVGNRFAYVADDGRAVVLHAGAIAQALARIYRAGRITDALTIDREGWE